MKMRLIHAIEDGTVIDHIASHRLFTIVRLFRFDEHDGRISIGNNLTSQRMGTKGIIKMEGRLLSTAERDVLGLFAEGATINIIERNKTVKKIIVKVPKQVHCAIPCPNETCISRDENIASVFLPVQQTSHTVQHISCRYCMRVFSIDDV